MSHDDRGPEPGLEFDERLHEWLEGAPGERPRGRPDAIARLQAVRRAVSDLPRALPPPDLAAALAARIAEDAESRVEMAVDPLEARLTALPRLQAPAGFAAATAARIASDATTTAPLDELETRVRALPRPAAPAGFASTLATRIAADAASQVLAPVPVPRPVASELNPTALSFLGATLVAAALAVLSLAWPYARTAAAALVEVGRTLPPGLLVTYALATGLALVASTGRVRPRLVTSLLAFTLGAAVVWPQALPFFGSARVEAGASSGTVVRLGGDLAVGGLVRGDAISVGGSVRLEPGGRVTGRVVTFLGDVNLAAGARVGEVSAVLGAFHAEGTVQQPARSATLPGLAAASALRPVRALFRTDAWPYALLGLVATAAALLLSLPGWIGPLERNVTGQPGPAIGLGLAGLFLVGPVAAVGGLSLVGAPLALVLAILTGLVFTAGLGLSALVAGRAARRRLGLTASEPLEVALGLALLAVTLPLPPLAVTVWLLAGAWGAGALVLAWRAGVLPMPTGQALEQAG